MKKRRFYEIDCLDEASDRKGPPPQPEKRLKANEDSP
jgi:hypothetical protein